jgi:hypothetical protein
MNVKNMRGAKVKYCDIGLRSDGTKSWVAMTQSLLLNFAWEYVVLNGQGNVEALKVIETYRLLFHAGEGELLGRNLRTVSESTSKANTIYLATKKSEYVEVKNAV